MKTIRRILVGIMILSVIMTATCFGVSAKDKVVKENNFSAICYEGGKTFYLSEYTGKSKNITTPTKIKGHKITQIGFPFIRYTDDIKKLIISDGIEVIGSQSVECATGLETVIMADSVKSIHMGAFYECTSLKNVYISKNLEDLTYACFNCCTALESIALPENLPDIGDCIFTECTSLEKIYIPKSVDYVGYSSFGGCENLTDVYYGGSKSDWKKIKIIKDFDGNKDLINAKIHYNHKHTLDEGTIVQPTKDCDGTRTYNCTECGMLVKAEILKSPIIKVEGLRVTKNTATSISLKWDAVKKATGYELYYSTNGKKWKKITATKNKATVKELKSGTTYKFKVRAIIGKKKSEYSFVFTTATKPAKVTLSSVTSNKTKQAVVTWKTVTGANGYNVEYSTSDDFKKKSTVTVKKQSAQKTTIKKLNKGKKYYVRVRAYKTVDGEKIYGAYSKVKSVKVK